MERKPHSQKDRQNEKAEVYVPDEGTRANPRKTTKKDEKAEDYVQDEGTR